MPDFIEINGIETNNLKNINISLKKKAINLLIGPSGSGKSSLVYDTIAKIGQYEYNSMFQDTVQEIEYKVSSYKNMIVTVPIKQINNNNNTRSTIGTYFNLNQYLSLVFSVFTKQPFDYFILNKEANLCPECHGLGFIKGLDINRIIDFDLPLNKCPIKCWNRYRDFYMDIIKCFCEEKGINSNKTFREISDEERNLIINGIGKKKHKIKYTRVGRLSVRNTEYYGVLTGKAMLPDFKMSGDFFGNNVCSVCNGQKYSSDHKNYIVNGLSIGEVMCIDFQELRKWVINIQKKTTGTNLEFSFQHIVNFVQKAIDLNLGHLYFNRTIPSLSGGELQRLRLIQVFNTQLTDVLIILDEPLAGISGEEEIKIYQNIKKLSGKHTLLIVDHHNIFYKDAAQIIALGPLSGKFGGEIIDAKKYIFSQNKPLYIIAPKEEESIIIKYKNAIYNYKGCNIRLSKNRLNIITGSSGVGKSTLLREYFSQYLENYKYINQKPLFGTGNSLVATVLDIANLIIDDFSKQNKVEKKLFFSGKGDKGVCPSCGGTGYVVFGNDYGTELKLICKDCEGAGFNVFLKKFKVREKTIFDVWNMTINEAYIFYQEYNKKISQKLNDAIEIMLGHLLIGQKTKTLSGGENIRIKILKSINDTALIFGIDEPFRGLNNEEIYKVVIFLNKLISKDKTIIVIDHEEQSFKYFTKLLYLKNNNGILCE